MRQSRKAGVQALLERCVKEFKSEAPLTAKAISWGVAPVINAAGRRGKADLAAKLLLEDNAFDANKLVTSICKLNDERKELQSENLEKFTPLLAEQCSMERDKILIVTSQTAEHGVTGIIASQIARRYHRPTVLLIVEGENATGAARSIEGFDITAAFAEMSDILIKYGGHNQAAGLTIKVGNIPEFTRRLRQFADKKIAPEMLVPELLIDCEIQPADISLDLIKELNLLEPYGQGNPYPIFCLRKVRVLEVSRVGADEGHLKLKISKGGNASIAAMGWGLGHIAEDLMPDSIVDLVVQLEVNTWQDKQTVQLIISDINTGL
jgi:single-stranded-DNA-specific exonuclease